MYIEKAIYENVGPLSKLQIDFPFDINSNPKPIIFVGENGCGKSILLSNIVDAFYEIAGKAFNNAVHPENYYAHQYYKNIDPIQIQIGQEFMYSYLQFNGDDIYRHYYVCKSGVITVDAFKQKANLKNINLQWKAEENYKTTSIKNEDVENVWNSNVICYFGPDRYEQPAWMGDKYYNLEEHMHPTILERFKGQLYNPISVKNVITSNLQWILDVIADSRPDVMFNQGQFAITHIVPNDLRLLGMARSKIEEILSTILGEEVYFSLNFRNSGSSRFKILKKSDNSIICPTLDSLSTGQIALFNMFSTIVRYADNNNINRSFHLEEIKGIVVIDEIELHLHSRLQKEVLPELIKLFPKVQFIITTHAPLFLLGMKEIYGEDNFEIYELPSAEKISVERFSEFSRAYDYIKETQHYQEEIKSIVDSLPQNEKPLIITEGPTDWRHMKTAFNVLCSKEEYRDLFNDLSFDFLEYEPKNSSSATALKIEMGNNALVLLCENLIKVPHKRIYIIIADRDTPKINQKLIDDGGQYKKWGNNTFSAILPIPDSRADTPDICIEHYYSDAEIKKEIEINGIKRHLYMGSDFNSNGYCYNQDRFCERKDLCGPGKISILDGTQGEKVRKLSDENDITNYALPKSDFADYVSTHTNEFDFTNFIPLFRLIKTIIDGTKNA